MQQHSHSGEEEEEGVKEEEEEGEWEVQKDGEEEELIFLYPHRQLHHHANDSLSTRCKVEALRQPNPTHTEISQSFKFDLIINVINENYN